MKADLARLEKNFRRHKVLDLNQLHRVFPHRSRRSLFRDLSAVGSLTSYSHRGGYYTIDSIARFDENGLWFHRNICFSKAGTLKNTVVEKVGASDNGQTHRELSRLLRIRLYSTLQELYRTGRIGRELLGRVYLYISADPERGAEQLQERRKYQAALVEMLRVVTDEEMAVILAEALRASPMIPRAEEVSVRLMDRGYHIEPRLVKQAYEAHGLEGGKKTPRRY